MSPITSNHINNFCLKQLFYICFLGYKLQTIWDHVLLVFMECTWPLPVNGLSYYLT